MKGDTQAEEAPMKGRLLLRALPIVRVAVPVGEEGSDCLAGTVPSSIAGPRRGYTRTRRTGCWAGKFSPPRRDTVSRDRTAGGPILPSVAPEGVVALMTRRAQRGEAGWIASAPRVSSLQHELLNTARRALTFGEFGRST